MRMPFGFGGILLLGGVLPALMAAASSDEDFTESVTSFDYVTEIGNGLDREDDLDCAGDCSYLKDQEEQYNPHKHVDTNHGMVRNISVELNLINATLESAVVQWIPSSDSAWPRYEVLTTWKKRGQSSNPTRDCVQNPSKLYECVIPGLEYDANYTVEVRGVDNGSKRGPSKYLTFKTLSKDLVCLQYTDYDLNTCPPEKPVGLSIKEIKLEDWNVNGTLHDIFVSWAPSKHPPLLYITRFQSWANNNQVGEIEFQNVTGNMTSVTFSSVLVGNSADLWVGAYSPGGLSEWACLPRRIMQGKLEPKPTQTQIAGGFNVTILTISVTILIVFFLVTGVGILVYRRYTKKKRSEERIRYFQSLDQKHPVAACSVGSKVAVSTVDDKWEIPFNSLLQGDILGEGAFGVVRKGLVEGRAGDKLPLLEVAVKMVRDDPSRDELRQFLQEIEMMKSVGQHQNIVSIIGCCTRGPKVMLVTEYCALGDLQRFLRKEWDRLCEGKQESQGDADAVKTAERVKYAQLALSAEGTGSGVECVSDGVATPSSPNKPTAFVNQMYDMEHAGARCSKSDGLLTSNDLLSFARQITVGMEFLAGNRVVHRDLAARNVLLCADRTVKISDFGLSRDIYEQNVYHKKCVGKLPIKWMAIESLLHQVYTTQSDVWSFGVLLWEIVTLGGNPYPSTQTNSVFKLLRAGYRMERPTNCSVELYNIMLHCWEAKPRERPTFSQLRAHLDQLLESSIRDQYLNLDLHMVNESPLTSTSTVEHLSSSASTRSRSHMSSGEMTAPAYTPIGSGQEPSFFRLP